jgi:hypothetical protein
LSINCFTLPNPQQNETNHSANVIAAGQYVVVITGPGFSKSINIVCE